MARRKGTVDVFEIGSIESSGDGPSIISIVFAFNKTFESALVRHFRFFESRFAMPTNPLVALVTCTCRQRTPGKRSNGARNYISCLVARMCNAQVISAMRMTVLEFTNASHHIVSTCTHVGFDVP